ncbi:hypothetical protein AB0K18_49365 [Nonomuraea sp. NPDC049421]|uniref:hypothetical protein n=1 Tax=Nonomuraea sp. NPDC049421 TaxID=3155275 RepID=UPI00343047FC
MSLMMYRKATSLGLCAMLMAACSVVDSTSIYTDVDRFGYVTANAFRVSHPEYVVDYGDRAFQRRPDEMAIDVHVSANMEGEGAVASFSIRQDEASGRISYTMGGDRRPVPLGEAIRRLDTPDSRKLASALRRVGKGGEPAKEEVDATLQRVSRAKKVTAVVELARPMTIDEIRSHKHLPVDNGVFSPALSEVPVYWDNMLGTFCRMCGGDGDEITQDFRRWVDSLQSSDEQALQHFGLSVARLKDAARNGKIYGFLRPAENPLLLRKLLKQDYVKSIHIVRIADHCTKDDPNECQWPEDERLYG